MMNFKQLADIGGKNSRHWLPAVSVALTPKDGVTKREKTPIGKALRQANDFLFARLRFCEPSQIYPCRTGNNVCRRENRR